MTRRKREELRKAAEEHAKARKEERCYLTDLEVANAHERRKRLARADHLTQSVLEKLTATALAPEDRDDPEIAAFVRLAQTHGGPDQSDRFRTLMRVILKRAPKVAEKDYWHACYAVCRYPWLRPIEAWEPRGKADRAVFRSLVDHLLGKYPVPQALYEVLFITPGIDAHAHTIMDFFIHVAQGGSPYKFFESGALPIMMTRKMCTAFMRMLEGSDFYTALRHAQVLTLGGSPVLARAFCGTPFGRGFVADEPFWLTAVRWFCEQPGVDPARVGPLMDFIATRKREDNGFTLKGRTVASLARAMEAWHWALHVKRNKGFLAYGASGFKGGTLKVVKVAGPNGQQTVPWTIQEIKNSKQLMEEGQAMKHCVFSYSVRIEAGTTSIWSLRLGPERMLTVEVANRTREIVQFRGKLNRSATAAEMAILRVWAAQNGLKMKTGRW